ncbi:MAG TPA: HlyD family efflux transporter periplasmic adaptor subunit [Anaeromyxobacteraceae bacterium]|nr:HlyD family efflux transporter periplasmic adaptor subunit [Anaeromyxobacteraceae bacterium]
MRGATTSSKVTLVLDPEVVRARKREAFLETLRRASHLAPVRVASKTTGAEGQSRAADAAPQSPRPRAQTELLYVVEEPKPKASTGLFRREAMQHRLASEEGRGIVRVSPPWTWVLVWTVVAALAVAVAASFVGEVEVTGRGRGIIRPTMGVRPLTSQLTGTVAQVEARSGERVKANATVLRVESPNVQAQLLEAERQYEAVRTQYSGMAIQQDRHYAEQVEHLRARSRRLSEQIESLKGSAAYYQRRLQADMDLLKKGLVSEMAVAEWRESLAQAQRQLSGAELTLDQTRQELASMEGRRQDDLWQRQQVLSAAQNKRDSLSVVAHQSLVVAPEDGTVEALLVRVGETVQAGQVVGKLIPQGSPIEVVSFLAERDRAFVKVGDEVHLELDQLPHAEYGTLRARVVRIGDDLASPAEVHDALGEEQKLDGPSYRVELEITDTGPADAAQVKLRTGTLMNVRYTLRRQKLATLLFNPLERWMR